MIARTTAGEEVLTQKTVSNDENPISDVYFEFGSQADNKWYKIGTVPEPTSGVLLLVGVAALALRRKNAA